MGPQTRRSRQPVPDPERSQRSKAVWAKASPETRERWCASFSAAKRTPEARQAQSERSKRFCASEEVRAAMRARSKLQIQRDAEAGRPSLVERGEPTSCTHWTPEQHQAAQLKRDAFFAKRRASVLSALSGEERKKKERDYAYQAKKQVVRHKRAVALLALPEFEALGYRWCYRNQAIAKAKGVVFVVDDRGEWHAKLGDQGEGSIGEARTEEDLAEDLEEEETALASKVEEEEVVEAVATVVVAEEAAPEELPAALAIEEELAAAMAEPED